MAQSPLQGRVVGSRFFSGGDFNVDGSIHLTNGDYLKDGVPISGGGGTTAFLGKVVSGSGDTYVVDLYGNGSGRVKTATVSVTIPQIADDEQIPAGTWINPVFRFTVVGIETTTTYECQVPIWVA